MGNDVNLSTSKFSLCAIDAALLTPREQDTFLHYMGWDLSNVEM